MAYWKKNETLDRIERDTESDIIEMKRQLDLGTEEAKKELGDSQIDLRDAATGCRGRIDTLSDNAKEGLQDIQSRLGKLNFLLAEEELDSVEKLDRHSNAILEEMRAVRQQIDQLEGETENHVKSAYGEVEAAWERFLRCLELIRMHLRATEEEASEKFRDERETLKQRLADRDEDNSVLTALWEGLKEHERWIIAFFQSPLEASPTPPPPGYASTTDTTSDHGSGG